MFIISSHISYFCFPAHTEVLHQEGLTFRKRVPVLQSEGASRKLSEPLGELSVTISLKVVLPASRSVQWLVAEEASLDFYSPKIIYMVFVRPLRSVASFYQEKEG
jgi:hypothetical protein